MINTYLAGFLQGLNEPIHARCPWRAWLELFLEVLRGTLQQKAIGLISAACLQKFAEFWFDRELNHLSKLLSLSLITLFLEMKKTIAVYPRDCFENKMK